MSVKNMNTLIRAYQLFADELTELQPVTDKNPEIAISFSQYIRAFSLCMILRVDKFNPDHKDFVNNLTVISLPEMDDEEYRHAVSSYDAVHYDDFIYQKQIITDSLMKYDLEHHTKKTQQFFNFLNKLAKAFESQDSTYTKPVEDFLFGFGKSASIFVQTQGQTLMNGRAANVQEQTTANTAPQKESHATPQKMAQNTSATQAAVQTNIPQTPAVDTQYVLRVIVPLLAMIGFIFGAFISEEYILLAIAIAPLCFLIAGLKAANRRCPRCGAWDSLITIKSNQVGQQKVKVRRNLHSSYYRTSGTHTFGSRQVFVNADEYTLKETYRCNICGHTMNGTRKVIDDGIRWG